MAGGKDVRSPATYYFMIKRPPEKLVVWRISLSDTCSPVQRGEKKNLATDGVLTLQATLL